MSDRCPLCDSGFITVPRKGSICAWCCLSVQHWPAVQAMKDRIAELEKVLHTMLDNCGCCEDVSPCSNCLRAEIALNPKGADQ